MSAPRTPRLRTLALATATALLLPGCGLLKPPAVAPVKADATLIPAQLPRPPEAPAAAADAAPMAWAQLVGEPRLMALVQQALASNRDLRVALLNVQRAQAQFAATDAARWPTLAVGGGASRAPNTLGKEANTFTAGVQMPAWELDLWGRLQNLSEAARTQWLATEAGRRAAELALVAQVLQAALSLQADGELLAIAQRTLDSRQQTLQLTELRERVGAASLLELQAQRTLVAQARAALAQARRSQAQDRNALALLLGQPMDEAAWAQALPAAPLGAQTLAEVPVGLSSQLLLRRPDVVQAEWQLQSAEASIQAARAAYLPSITLNAQAGQASAQLASLFQGGHFVYTVAANAALTVFDAGRRQANVDSAVAARAVALAQYERAVQGAFRDTADALAGIGTWRAQLEAQAEVLQAARETQRLTLLRHRQGAASELERLDAERSLLAAEQAQVQLRLAELANRVALVKALGGPVQ